VRKQLDEPSGFDPSIWQGLAELGLPGLLVPEALGGAGLGLLELGVALEELGRALHTGPLLGSALGATRLLLDVASPAEQRDLLPALASGAQRACVALFEPGSRGAWDAPATALRGGRLFGVKEPVLDAAAADLLLVVAREGVLAVEAKAPGVRLARLESLDPTRQLFRVSLDGAPARRLGSGDARDAVADAADALAVGLVADGLGAAGRALELALAHAKLRQQFGRPIGSFQALQHLLVDALQDVELTRASLYHALWAQDAAPEPERRSAAALVKAHASEALPRVGATAIQVFGGTGFTFEMDVHLYYRRCLSLSLLHGDAGHHLEQLARHALDTEPAA